MSELAIEPGTPTVNSAWRLDVNTGTTETPTWTQVRGLNNFVPVINNTRQDATDYDNEGWGADAVTLRKWQCTATAFRKEYPTGGGTTRAYDPGQEELREAANTLDRVHIRWYDRSSSAGEAYQGFAVVEWTPAGGGAEGLQSVNVVLLGQGARQSITNPTPA